MNIFDSNLKHNNCSNSICGSYQFDKYLRVALCLFFIVLFLTISYTSIRGPQGSHSSTQVRLRETLRKQDVKIKNLQFKFLTSRAAQTQEFRALRMMILRNSANMRSLIEVLKTFSIVLTGVVIISTLISLFHPDHSEGHSDSTQLISGINLAATQHGVTDSPSLSDTYLLFLNCLLEVFGVAAIYFVGVQIIMRERYNMRRIREQQELRRREQQELRRREQQELIRSIDKQELIRRRYQQELIRRVEKK